MEIMKRRTVATKSTLITLSDKAKEEKGILLKVKGQKKAEDLSYLMGKKTPLYELMLDYTERICVPFNSVRLVYNGSPIDPFLTAKHLKMKDGGIIDVVPLARDTVKAATQSTYVHAWNKELFDRCIIM
ncbi:Small ubiquitin-related modifier, SUMO [Corchorus olitorius]|uniref:Small ubiquitin-related modifier, SUMO n=1 Tax=Corchorus olitorius TaxID=93759 RepID=A0A1R3IZD0_9ROSI|nr:Small ubiquitin-related modifier, SUMO [Corchorus olitorius]